VCVRERERARIFIHLHSATHTHVYIHCLAGLHYLTGRLLDGTECHFWLGAVCIRGWGGIQACAGAVGYSGWRVWVSCVSVVSGVVCGEAVSATTNTQQPTAHTLVHPPVLPSTSHLPFFSSESSSSSRTHSYSDGVHTYTHVHTYTYTWTRKQQA
jgi:hypothetical protein